MVYLPLLYFCFMNNRNTILHWLDAEISRLQQARQLLGGHDGPFPMVANGRRRTRHMSAEARARIAASQRARWARVKASKKK